MSVSLYDVLFLQRTHIVVKTKRHINPFILQMQNNEAAKRHMWLQFLATLASSSFVAALRVSSAGSISCFAAVWGENTSSILSCTQWTHSRATDLLTHWTTQDTAHNCFLSLYLCSHGLTTRCRLCLKLSAGANILFTNNMIYSHLFCLYVVLLDTAYLKSSR